MTDEYTNGKFLDQKSFLEQAEKNDLSGTDEKLSDLSSRALRGIQHLSDEDSLPDILNRLDKRIDQRVAGMPARRIPILHSTAFRAAAAVLLLLVPAYFLFLKPPAADKLAAAYFEHQPSAIAHVGPERGKVSGTSAKERAFQHYDSENYADAVPAFRQYLDTQPGDLESRFYYGIALLGIGEASMAVEQFDQVRQAPPRQAYLDAALWYQALSHLLEGEREAAIELLNNLAGKDGDYQEKAERLLKDLS